MEQLVTAPTHDWGRTLDQCFVSKELKHKIEVTQHSVYFSDHDALCIKYTSEDKDANQ